MVGGRGWGRQGVACLLNHTAGSVGESEAGGAGSRMEEKWPCHLSSPLPPLSPCKAAPYSLRSTLEKIDCLFLPDCLRVTGCRGRVGGGGGEGAAASSSGWIFLLLCL